MVQTRKAAQAESGRPEASPAAQAVQAIESQRVGEAQFHYVPRFLTYGAVEYTTEVTLPRNALVETFDVKVTAARATLALASEVAQVRAGPSTDGLIQDKGLTVIVDFGTPRTVSAITVPPPFQIVLVRTWNGAQFTDPAAYLASSLASNAETGDLLVTAAGPASTAQRAVLRDEPRTERLSIGVGGPTDGSDLVANLSLVLPDAPGDLELRIDGQAPAWTHPGPAQPGASTELGDDAWNESGERIVHLADALGAQTGDPKASDDGTFALRLTSQAPGLLRIEEQARELRRIRRVRFDGRDDTTLEFTEEGAIELALDAPGLPAAATVEEVRMTVEADFEEPRTLPPVGPEPYPTVDLTLDPERAALIRLPPGTGLVALTAIRVPLAAGDRGAEARVVLWTNREAVAAEPLETMAEGISEPKTLPPGAGAEAAWTTFEFPAAIDIDPENPPWAGVLITRGTAVLGLAASAGVADTLETQVFRLGPHGGPWSLPPAGLRSGPFAAVRGRVRMTGLAPKETPIAPLTAEIGGASVVPVPLDPGPRGLLAVIPGGSGGAQVLRLVAHGPGTVTLRDVDIVTVE